VGTCEPYKLITKDSKLKKNKNKHARESVPVQAWYREVKKRWTVRLNFLVV
jgi:hypothetical protein